MLFSVLTKKLNRESLTKNLITFNFNISGLTEKSDFLGGESTRIKKGRSWTVCRFNVGEGLLCHDISKSADSQTKKNFSDNDCMTTEFYKNVYEMNNFRLRILQNKKVFEKTQMGWRQILLASHPSRNKFLVRVAKIYREADFKVS